jgi:hypothetical protein
VLLFGPTNNFAINQFMFPKVLPTRYLPSH